VQWKITVKPVSEAMDNWVWLAESADRESYLTGTGTSHEEASAEAKAQVDAAAAARRAIVDATTVEDYLPAGEPPEEPVPEVPLIVLESGEVF
jgi:hypothetical protein